MDSLPYQLVILVFVFYVLYAVDVANYLSAPNSVDAVVNAFLIVAMVAFSLDIGLTLFVKPRGAVAWAGLAVDVLATAAVLVDITWVADAARISASPTTSTGSAVTMNTQISTQAARILRLIRVVRIIRVVTAASALIKGYTRRRAGKGDAAQAARDTGAISSSISEATALLVRREGVGAERGGVGVEQDKAGGLRTGRGYLAARRAERGTAAAVWARCRRRGWSVPWPLGAGEGRCLQMALAVISGVIAATLLVPTWQGGMLAVEPFVSAIQVRWTEGANQTQLQPLVNELMKFAALKTPREVRVTSLQVPLEVPLPAAAGRPPIPLVLPPSLGMRPPAAAAPAGAHSGWCVPAGAA